MVPKCVHDIAEMSRTLGLEAKVVQVTSAEASREFPTPYGIFSILYDGKLIAGRPISGTRFWFIMREIAEQPNPGTCRTASTGVVGGME
jgi:hypothetical protein